MVAIEDAVVIVAHPDDEILWFSSVLGQCKRIVACFGDSADPNRQFNRGREVVASSYPLTKAKFLKLQQSDAYQAFNWKHPVKFGDTLEFRRGNRAYARNSELLFDILRAEVENEKLVITHNPWGDYGNEEHVQVFNVLNKLRQEIQFELYVSSYVSNRSHALMSKTLHLVDFRSLAQDCLVRSVDLEFTMEIKNLYLQHNCWTWMPTYEWPLIEMFYPVAKKPGSPKVNISSSIPLNYVDYKFSLNAIARFMGRILPSPVKQTIKGIVSRRTNALQ